MSNARSATAIIAEVRNGHLVVEASEAIKTAIAAVGEHGKKAVVTIDLTIMPPHKGAEHLIDAPILITGEVTTKLPKADPEPSLFFVGKDGNATQNPSPRDGGLQFGVAGAADGTNKS